MEKDKEALLRSASILKVFDENSLSFLGAIFNNKGAKILYLLYSISPNTKMLRYSDIADYTGLGKGNQLYYPLQNLQHLGLIMKNQLNDNTAGYSLTGTGQIAADLLHTMIKDLVANAEVLPENTKDKIASIQKAIGEVEESLRARKIPLNGKVH
jgi:hypothetical protein